MLWYPDAAGYVYLEVEDQRDADHSSKNLSEENSRGKTQ